jgi:hypothetical protein
MARYALVRDGKVVNIAEWTGNVAWDPGEGISRVRSDTAQTGDAYAGGAFGKPFDLAEARLQKWEAVKAIRDKLENGNAPTPFGAAQCDDRSKLRISGLVQMAQIAAANSQPFAEEYTLADNSVVGLDAAQAVGLGVAVGKHVSAIHARSRALRVLIEAASSQADLDAIDVNAGWP